MPATAACPTSQTFEQLRLGRLAIAEVEVVARHLETCPRCADSVQNLRVEDTLIDVLRCQETLTDADPSPVVKALIERLHKQMPAAQAISFSCTGCGKPLKVKVELVGKKVKCPGCGTVVVVPSEITEGAGSPGIENREDPTL